MKICAIICEFNPFHNGHAYLLKRARELSGCDAVVCVMSGQFTQRGEICRTDKFLRAKHAILCGADAVLELPTPFAVAPAEIFARGGVKTVLSAEGEITLAFGCESGSVADFWGAADLLINETEEFKKILANGLADGESFIKAYNAAFEECGGKKGLLSSPNNVLGVEYAKAAVRLGANFSILPIERVGAGFNDDNLRGNFSSATAIRANINDDRVKTNMPICSYEDFIASRENKDRFERLAADALFLGDRQKLKRVYGCTEGLENKLIACSAGKTYKEIVEVCTNKRYSSSRIRRIICANLLGLYADETEEFLNAELPLKVLAVNKKFADGLLPAFSAKKECTGWAEKCGRLTSEAYALWRHLSQPLAFENANEKMILV